MSRYDQFAAVIEAWKRRDIEAVLAAMDDDIVWHYAAAAAPPARGKAKARAFLERFSATIASIRWRIFAHAETADTLFVEGVDEYDSVSGVTVLAPYAGVIEFKGDKIIGWRDYVDTGVIAASEKGEPPSKQVVELIGRPAA